jgi:hypothetical protein
VAIPTGRRRLTWVTALTVASLLLGSGAINALAEGRDSGHGHGDEQGEQGETEHHQTKHTVVAPVFQGAPAQASSKHEDVEDNNTASNNRDVERKHGDDEDLVTPPARATEDVRPGLGCGDENHVHTGTGDCKQHESGDDDGAMNQSGANTNDAAMNQSSANTNVDDESNDD